MAITFVHVRRTSGELESGWVEQFSRDIDGVEWVRVRCFVTTTTFVEKDVLREALDMWQAEAAEGADVVDTTLDGPLLPTVDRLDVLDGFARLLEGS